MNNLEEIKYQQKIKILASEQERQLQQLHLAQQRKDEATSEALTDEDLILLTAAEVRKLPTIEIKRWLELHKVIDITDGLPVKDAQQFWDVFGSYMIDQSNPRFPIFGVSISDQNKIFMLVNPHGNHSHGELKKLLERKYLCDNNGLPSEDSPEAEVFFSTAFEGFEFTSPNTTVFDHLILRQVSITVYGATVTASAHIPLKRGGDIGIIPQGNAMAGTLRGDMSYSRKGLELLTSILNQIEDIEVSTR